MFGSSWKGGALAGAIAVLAAPAAYAVDATRLDLLAGEAVSVMGHAAATPSRMGLVVLIGIPLATMLSAYLGTYLGIRGLSFGSLRTADGWREVAYRFRSEEPMSVGKDVIKRMSGVLDDIEELGKNIRTRSAKPAEEATSAIVDTVDAIETTAAEPTRETPRHGKSGTTKSSGIWPGRRSGRKAESAPPPKPVTFLRREEPAPEPVPDTRSVHAPVTAVAAAPPPQPIARPAGAETDRSVRYRRARALLDEGHDREAVRSMTGLKLAEVDLLRCAGASGGSA